MLIKKPLIKSTLCLNVHPVGLGVSIDEQVAYIKSQKEIKGFKNVLVLGGSTGYGLATVLALGLNGANTICVTYPAKKPENKKVGDVIYWNTHFLQKALNKNKHYIVQSDAFSNECKDEVLNLIKKEFGEIDLVVYSIASARRTYDGITYTSSLRPINNDFSGLTYDFNSHSVKEVAITSATKEEIDNTIKVMGGEDFALWLDYLMPVLANGIKALSYSYIGPECTYPIYRHGTIGKAKEHLEATSLKYNEILAKNKNGMCASVALQCTVTRASSVIPNIPLYIASFYKTAQEFGISESIIEHIYRTFKDMIYGDSLIVDENNVIRMDHLEMNEKVQERITELMDEAIMSNDFSMVDFLKFENEFLMLHGFGIKDVDYEKDFEIKSL